ncbi:Uncharacterised protein [Salmonella enterica subsp. arizonae]|uniref:Uncharacterized protein n=1 Tax=Salmonella enterica subsp. arizonae TaxID=59203 RepID=A0A379TGE5_SALER|nr:Uncharacterised protein [Salmonella enterica subsp. arizonae]
MDAYGHPNCGAMIFSHAVLHAVVEPGMANIKVLFATPATARDCRVAVPISSNESIRNTSPKPFHFTIEQRQQRFRRLIAFG